MERNGKRFTDNNHRAAESLVGNGYALSNYDKFMHSLSQMNFSIMHIAETSYQVSVKVSGSCLLVSDVETLH